MRSGRESEPIGGLDPNDVRGHHRLEPSARVAEKFADGLRIEPPSNLIRGRHGESIAGDIGKAAGLELGLKRVQFGLGSLRDGVDAADFIGKRGV